MQCAGEIVLHLFANNRICPVNALICDETTQDLMVSWHDCIDLQILAANFPGSTRIHDYSFADPAAARTIDTNISEKIKEEMKRKFKSIVKNDIDSKPMKADPLKIFLSDNAIPRRCLTVRQTPIHMQEEAEQLVKKLLKSGIIVKVNDNEPTPWVAPGFFVPKPHGKGVRLVTDYREINKFIKRPIHPFPSARDCLKRIPHTAKVFASLDCLHGYFQLALEEESSFLTTFLLPSGRYRYVRAPMGLSASSDGFCFASDAMLEGLDFAVKIVDDILIWAKDYNELQQRIEIILKRCKKYNVTVSEKKMKVGAEIPFAGYLVSERGFKPDPSQVDGIRKFPSPTNITELRSFLGLANQLGWFLPDLVHATTNMRELLKKEVAFQWMPEHEKELNLVKFMLTSPLVVKPFQPGLQTILLTDASRTKGLGYALMQKNDKGQRFLVCCGSTTLNTAQRNYAMVELEALAILYAIDKCSFYLISMPFFEVWTDHRPLEGVFKKDLDATLNHRLATIREKLANFNFTVKHIPGKNNVIADALSRAPLFDQEWMAATAASTSQCDPALQFLFDAAENDLWYQSIVKMLETGEELHQVAEKNHPAQTFAEIWPQLSIMANGHQKLLLYDSRRLVIPEKAKQDILKLLHLSHSGITKTKALAKDLYFWPGMYKDIQHMVEQCQVCREMLPSQATVPNEPFDLSQAEPMSHVGADLFQFAGKDYLIVVDRLSGYPFPMMLSAQGTHTVCQKMKYLFDNYGYPKVIRSDGGPCFASMAFNDFCSRNHIKHELSSAYNATSNGLAEAAVKSMKNLITKCKANKEDFDAALLEWRAAPRQDGPSPAQIFFRRQLRTQLPRLQHKELTPKATQQRQSALNKKIEQFHSTSKNLKPLPLGSRVLVQHPQNKRWREEGVIVEIRDNGLSYNVLTDVNRTLLRNRRFLKPAVQLTDKELHAQPAPNVQPQPQPAPNVQRQPTNPPILRRSSRPRKPVKH